MIKVTLMHLSFICIAYTSLVATVLADSPPLLTPQELDLYVNDALKTFNVPGAAVGLVVDDQIILSRGYGTCAVDESLPVTERTLFSIASCTKAFTAHLLERLAEERKISLDDPVITYIPEFRLYDQDLTENVNIRDLLAHRTGVHRHDALWFYSNMSRNDILPLLRYLEPISGLREQYQYNNMMYSVAGMVIERVTGQSWEEAVTSRILRPLGMHDSNASIDEMQSSSSYSFPHAEIGGTVTKIPFHNTSTVNPGGGINATIADLTKWVRFQLRTMTPEKLKVEMPLPSPQQGEEIYFSGYGLGWYIGKYKGHDTLSHGGDIDGFSSEVALLPAEGIGLVILTNSGSDGRALITSIKNRIFNAVLGKESTDWMSLLKQGRDKAKVELQEALDQFSAIIEHPYEISNQNDYVGTYHHPAYGILEITIEGRDLMISVGNKKMGLYPKSEDLFAIELRELLYFGINPITEVEFRRDSTGEIDQIEAAFEKFRGAKPILFMHMGSGLTP